MLIPRRLGPIFGGMLLAVRRQHAEPFSFALAAVVLEREKPSKGQIQGLHRTHRCGTPGGQRPPAANRSRTKELQPVRYHPLARTHVGEPTLNEQSVAHSFLT